MEKTLTISSVAPLLVATAEPMNRPQELLWQWQMSANSSHSPTACLSSCIQLILTLCLDREINIPSLVSHPNSLSTEYTQLLPASLAKVSQRIDMSIDPILPHFLHCDVRREIFIDNDPNDPVGGAYNFH